MRDITTLILVATSTSLGFSLYKQRSDRQQLLVDGAITGIGGHGAFEILTEGYSEAVRVPDHRAALRMAIDHLHRNSHIAKLLDIDTVIYRISHGGGIYSGRTVLSQSDAHKLLEIAHLTPEGRAVALLVRAGTSQLPSATHIGVFDTAPLPQEVSAYALDEVVTRRFNVRRYAFGAVMHHAAYAAAYGEKSEKSRQAKRRTTISVVIDDDVSVAAMVDGVIVESTTGFTAADGLPGLYKSGALDPRIPLYLAAHLRMTPQQVDLLLSSRSGLAGMTGKRSYDEIVAGARKRDAACIGALMLLSSRISAAIAAIATAIGVPDTIVFSGKGTSWVVIEEVCDRLSFLGLRLGKRRTGLLSVPSSRVRVLQLHLDERQALLVAVTAQARATLKKRS